jgi:hypothetical protein
MNLFELIQLTDDEQERTTMRFSTKTRHKEAEKKSLAGDQLGEQI